MEQLKDDRKYLDAGKRNTKDDSHYNTFLDDFVSTSEGRTKEDIINHIIASDWRPPISKRYTSRQEKIEFLMGYLNSMVSEGYLRQENGVAEKIYPEIQHPDITELDLMLAGYYFPILVELAKERGSKITYGDLLKKARSLHPEYFHAEEGVQKETDFSTGRRLGVLWRFAVKQDYPIISALVINAGTGECGHGITDYVDPVAEREKVYAFDWASVADNFMSHLSYERATNRSRKVKKPKKRSSQEASKVLGTYWKETQDKWPVEIREHREELQAKIGEGFDPATVFAEWVLKQPSKKNTPDYVYLAEYRNALTDERIEGWSQVKIGCTSDPESRALALSGGVKAPIKVILTRVWKVATGNAFAVEQLLHGHFLEHHVTGEWFDGLDGALAELVQEQLTANPQTNKIVAVVIPAAGAPTVA